MKLVFRWILSSVGLFWRFARLQAGASGLQITTLWKINRRSQSVREAMYDTSLWLQAHLWQKCHTFATSKRSKTAVTCHWTSVRCIACNIVMYVWDSQFLIPQYFTYLLFPTIQLSWTLLCYEGNFTYVSAPSGQMQSSRWARQQITRTREKLDSR